MNEEFNKQDLDVKIIKSKRKTVGIQVYADNRVVLRIPYRMTKAQAMQIFDKNSAWIIEKIGQMKKSESTRIKPCNKAMSELTSTELNNIRTVFREKTAYYCNIMNVRVGRITVRNQKTRWGSCSSKGNVNFNYQLYYMPETLLDYVVIHELAHRKYMNHSKDFWKEVQKYCPDYKERRKELRKYST